MSLDPIAELRPYCTYHARQVRIPVPVWIALFWLHGALAGISLIVVGWRVTMLQVLFVQLFDLFLSISMLGLVIYAGWLVVQKAREDRHAG